MSERTKLQHKDIDATQCPRCGSTDYMARQGDPDGEPEGTVLCRKCGQTWEVVRQYGIKYIYWTDDEGQHTIYDTCNLLMEAAQDLLDAADAARHCLETPGDFTDHERACLIQDLDFAIAKAKGESHV